MRHANQELFRVCQTCGEIKPREDMIRFLSHGRWLYRSRCRKCHSLLMISIRSKKRDEIRAKGRAYYWKNKDKAKAYQLKNRDAINRTHKLWARNNKDKRRRTMARWLARKSEGSLRWRMAANMRSRIRSALLSQGLPKRHRDHSLLGCSSGSFRLYIESRFTPEMSWDNYGTVWELDHIMPCALFDLSKESNVKACFHFSNYRPLLKHINRAKSDLLPDGRKGREVRKGEQQ